MKEILRFAILDITHFNKIYTTKLKWFLNGFWGIKLKKIY